nr:TetR/AcrR family transcriptional regulator [Frondihabitans sp. VKM Ac-2883]
MNTPRTDVRCRRLHGNNNKARRARQGSAAAPPGSAATAGPAGTGCPAPLVRDTGAVDRHWDPEQHTFTSPDPARGPTASREKILEAATKAFNEDGILAVGIDRIISDAQTTKTTFYKHFGSRANLELEYVELLCARDREALAAVAATATSAAGAVELLLEQVEAEIHDPGYRRSALLNAAAAFPDQGHPVRAAIAAHELHRRVALEAILADAGHVVAAELAATVSFLCAGAHAAATIGSRSMALATFRTAVRALSLT